MDEIIKDKSFGIVPAARREDGIWRFLLIKQQAGHWAFPKGHAEEDETEIEAATRELEEETGVSVMKVWPNESWSENYIFEQGGKRFDKTVTYFLGIVKNTKVTPQAEEVDDYMWLEYKEARKKLTFENAKRILDGANASLHSR
jgi:bis(5'-nucleosidyl)-tetraphosphatase